ncbi:MAG: Endonuclease V [Candidatus Woesearchaeota archaeon]|nr:Endonuclease V [Candidatus Woesearchaeota archaeon]
MDINKLKQEQIKLAKKIVTRDDFSKIKTIAGCTTAYTFDRLIIAIVVMDYETFKPIESKVSVSKAKFPYMRFFLSYREAPAIIELFSGLENKPDMLMCNSNGIIHPRKIGAASQIGLSLDIPTIGVASSLYCGTVENKRVMIQDQPRGYQLLTKEHANPIYVSPGHKISRTSALKITKKCIKQSKLPEPLRAAHKIAAEKKRKVKNLIKKSNST